MLVLPETSVSRRYLLALSGASVFTGTSGPAAADEYPARPIRLTLGYSAGGGTDHVTRIIAARLSHALSQPVVVVNQPGASGAIALERIARSRPDGYDLIVVSAADTILPALRAALPFDMARDLAPVAPAVTGALALVVNPALPVRSVTDLVALARSRPGALNYGSPGVGNSQHLAGELFNRLAGTRIVHVPFRGGAEAINATLAGDTEITFASVAPARPLIEEGRLRLLAVTTAARSAALPDTPTVAEAGVAGYSRATWFGVAGPAGTPTAILDRLNAAIVVAMHEEGTRRVLLAQGLEPFPGTQADFAAFVRSELTGNAAIVRDMGIAAD